MGLNELIDKAIERTIADGIKPDEKLVKKDRYEETEKAYRLFGTWFTINFKSNLVKVLEENKKKVEEI